MWWSAPIAVVMGGLNTHSLLCFLQVTIEEFKAVLVDYEYSEQELEQMFRAMDLDGTGVVHYSGT